MGARRRLAGARAQNHGAAFETWLARYIFAPMTARGALVRFDKLSPPMRPIWDATRRRVVMLPVAAGGADWVLLAPGGRYLALEAKSTGEGRFYREHIEPHQVKHLDAAAAAGGGAFLALQFREGPTGTAYLVPWHAAPWHAARTAPSLTPADCAAWVIRGWIDAARLVSAL